MKTRWITLLFSCLLTVACPASDFAEHPVQIIGRLFIKTFPGPPNYESIESGDKPETAWILTVDTKGNPEEYQLVLAKDDVTALATLKKSQGRLIHVKGIMWLGHTGHHHTKYLIDVDAVFEAMLP